MVQEALEMMWCLARVVFVLVDAHDDGQAIALGRGGDDDLLGAGGEVALGLLHIGEQAGGFDHQVHAQRLPRQLRGVLGADDLDLLAVDHQHIVLGLVGGGLLGADRAVEAALGGVILEQVSEVVRRNDIAHGDDFDVLADQALFDHRPEHQASDAAEPINCNFHCHSSISVLIRVPKLTAHLTERKRPVNEEFPVDLLVSGKVLSWYNNTVDANPGELGLSMQSPQTNPRLESFH